MYEMTHKGAWFKWSALDRKDKKLVAISLAAQVPVGAIAGLAGGRYGYRFGYWLGSGGETVPADTALDRLVTSPGFALFVLAGFACALVSAFAWWRFSLRQDELFNRIQNYAIGRGCGWAIAVATGWWYLSLGGWTGTLPLGWLLLLACALVYVFWFRAVRRWA